MARVNVEQKALTDSRFKALGLAIGATIGIAAAAGIGLMTFVWNECQERETTTLSPEQLYLITGIENVSVELTKCGLGSPVKGGRIRIHGTKGRIEWLANARKEGRLGGKAGGRPAKPVGDTPVGLSKKTPPTPAPALKEEPRPKREKRARTESKFFAADSAEVELSERLLSLIRQRNPNHRSPDLQKWAHHVDLTVRLDHRDPAEIRAMIEWCQADEFWQNNILSTAALRTQFDQLVLKSRGRGPRSQCRSTGLGVLVPLERSA